MDVEYYHQPSCFDDVNTLEGSPVPADFYSLDAKYAYRKKRPLPPGQHEFWEPAEGWGDIVNNNTNSVNKNNNHYAKNYNSNAKIIEFYRQPDFDPDEDRRPRFNQQGLSEVVAECGKPYCLMGCVCHSVHGLKTKRKISKAASNADTASITSDDSRPGMASIVGNRATKKTWDDYWESDEEEDGRKKGKRGRRKKRSNGETDKGNEKRSSGDGKRKLNEESEAPNAHVGSALVESQHCITANNKTKKLKRKRSKSRSKEAKACESITSVSDDCVSVSSNEEREQKQPRLSLETPVNDNQENFICIDDEVSDATIVYAEDESVSSVSSEIVKPTAHLALSSHKFVDAQSEISAPLNVNALPSSSETILTETPSNQIQIVSVQSLSRASSVSTAATTPVSLQPTTPRPSTFPPSFPASSLECFVRTAPSSVASTTVAVLPDSCSTSENEIGNSFRVAMDNDDSLSQSGACGTAPFSKEDSVDILDDKEGDDDDDDDDIVITFEKPGSSLQNASTRTKSSKDAADEESPIIVDGWMLLPAKKPLDSTSNEDYAGSIIGCVVVGN